MRALEEKSTEDQVEKMTTTIEKEEIEELSRQKGGLLAQIPIDCKPRGCISRGGLY